MRIQDPTADRISSDLEQISTCLPLHRGTRLLELGCGRAAITRALAEAHPDLTIVATEVDRIQHEKNLQISDLPNVRFVYGGAQEIALDDASVDAVILLKSLHHVPGDMLDQALSEIHRVLVPGGLGYVSEPVFAGPFNDILRLFHDEEAVRRAAFEAVRRAVDLGLFTLERQIFFLEPRRFESFQEFEEQVLDVTHTHFDIDDALLATIRRAYGDLADTRSLVDVPTPQRVDLLRRPR